MRVEEGRGGQIMLYGRPEEWMRITPNLADVASELKQDVLPAARASETGWVLVNFRQAMTIMAVMEDRELTRSLVHLILATGHDDT
jgi:hypothetical protein